MLSHDFLSIFVVNLELSSFLPSRVKFASEFLEALFFFTENSLEIQCFLASSTSYF